MTPTQTYYSLTAHKTVEALKRRKMEGYFCETKEDALKKVLELMPEGSSVAWGGSQTLIQAGILHAVKSGSYRAIDRDSAPNPVEKAKCELEAFSADYYLMSTNAITFSGTLINIDGFGNRLAALMYGPKNVIIVAGANKLVPNEEAGMLRARNLAAPMNTIRIGLGAPCVSAGLCHNCNHDECACSHILTTRMSRQKNRIKVILVGESLGF